MKEKKCIKVKEVIKRLESEGFHFVSMRGDHRKYKKDGHEMHVIVSGKLSDDVDKGTYNNILKQAGLKK